jgi:hypothetical protein
LQEKAAMILASGLSGLSGVSGLLGAYSRLALEMRGKR